MGNENQKENDEFENDEFENDEYFQSISSSDKNNDISQDIYPFPQNIEIPNDEKTFKKGLFITNKRGRKRKSENDHEGDNIGGHDKYSLDNIRLKINTHFFAFIMDYANCILKYFGFKEEFKNVDYKNKGYLNHKELSLLKDTIIGELISQDISPKYKREQKNKNKILYNEVIKNPIIKNLFSESYITLFQNVYYKNIKIINLEKYGEEAKDVVLYLNGRVKTFDDFINKKVKNKKNIFVDEFKDDYKKRILKCINKSFLKNIIV